MKAIGKKKYSSQKRHDPHKKRGGGKRGCLMEFMSELVEQEAGKWASKQNGISNTS